MLIQLNKKKNSGVYTQIDDKYNYLDKIGWSINKSHGYVQGRYLGEVITLHRVIMMLEHDGVFVADQQIDHINGNKLDNRAINLRVCTRSQNQCNRGVFSNSQSNHKGVSPHEGKWQAQISINGKAIYLGRFSTKEEAHDAYCAAADKYHEDFANYGKPR